MPERPPGKDGRGCVADRTAGRRSGAWSARRTTECIIPAEPPETGVGSLWAPEPSTGKTAYRGGSTLRAYSSSNL